MCTLSLLDDMKSSSNSFHVLCVQESKRITFKDNNLLLSTKCHIIVYIYVVEVQNTLCVRGPNQGPEAFRVEGVVYIIQSTLPDLIKNTYEVAK